MRRLGKVARYSAYGALALVALLVTAVLLLPEILDRPRVVAQLQAKLSAAVNGEVRWQSFRLGILPGPHATLRGLEVKTAAASLGAEEVTVALRLWPLFEGRAEIVSVKLERPALQLTIVPTAEVPKEARLEPEQDPLQAYGSAMKVVVDALREFAPDTVVQVENAAIDVHVEGVPPIQARNLALRATTGTEGVAVEAGATSPYWTTMKLAGRIQYSDLSSTAQLHLTRIQGQAWLDWLLRSSGLHASVPNVDLSIGFRGDPAKALEVELDGRADTLELTRGAQRFAAAPVVAKATLVADAGAAVLRVASIDLGASRLAKGELRYALKDGAIAGEVGYDLDLPQIAGYARQAAPDALERVESISGSLHGRIKLAGNTSEPHVGVRVEKSDAAVQVKGLPGPVRLEKAAVEADPRIVKAQDTALSMPAGRLLLTSLRYTLKDGATAAAADFDLALPQTLALVRSVLPEESRASLDSIESLDGRARGNVKLALAKSGWNVVGEIVHSDAKVQVRGLPGPATLAGVAVRARPKAVSIENARVAFLDSSVTASARLSDFQNGPKVEGSVAAATIGAKALAWVWQSAALPPRLDLKTPIQVTVPHFTWGPKPALDLQANARFDAGPALAVDMAWSPTALDVRRATIKDAMTDVTVALRSAGAVIEGSYGGTLDSRSLAAMRKSATAPAGEVSGDLRFRIDREQRSRSMAQGTLKGRNLDLSALAGQPAKLERLELSADGAAVRIGEAALDWNGQRVALRGDLKRGAEGPVIDAQVDSPGILIDALLPKTPAQAPDKAGKADKTPDAPAIWPLPVTGRIAMRAGFIQYAHYKVAPVVTTLVLEEKRAHLDTQEAQICGIALPFTADATPDGGFAVAAQITAQKQPVEQTAKCLTGEGVQLTGTMDLKASLQTEGKVADLVRNLRGSVTADVRDGQVMKFALIGNILSMQNVVALVTQGGPKLGAEGFPFRKLAAKGRLDKGLFFLDEGVFHSNTIGLGANGWISLSDFQTRLTVLVAPLALVDEAVRKLPVLGYVIGGTFTSLPVGVSGDIRDPTVVPLGPRAITNELTGIFERTITLPGRLVPGETKGKP